jgi:glycosyltransferase involved in cell wall biosynthesis
MAQRSAIPSPGAPTLLVAAGAGVCRDADGVRIDAKFASGMASYARHWPGEVACLVPEVADPLPFSVLRREAELPFALRTFPAGRPPPPAALDGADMLLASADGGEFLDLARAAAHRGLPVVAVIENVLPTRLSFAMLDDARAWPRRLRAALRALLEEPGRRRVLRAAAGLQANGHPAFDAYAPINRHPMLFLDHRISRDLLVTEAEQAARAERVLSGAPLALIHSGRLETLKGAQDLVPLCRALAARGVPFELHVFGQGRLAPALAEGVRAAGLSDRVTLHGSVDFETGLVPFARRHGDLFVSCHRQSDPSCTYMESFGCGLPVVGYDNRMLARLVRESGAGLVAPMARVARLADRVAGLHRDRAQLVAASNAARTFAAARPYEDEMARRIDHIRAVAEEAGRIAPGVGVGG